MREEEAGVFGSISAHTRYSRDIYKNQTERVVFGILLGRISKGDIIECRQSGYKLEGSHEEPYTPYPTELG